jgi:hypothetical protein
MRGGASDHLVQRHRIEAQQNILGRDQDLVSLHAHWHPATRATTCPARHFGAQVRRRCFKRPVDSRREFRQLRQQFSRVADCTETPSGGPQDIGTSAAIFL